MIAPDLILRRPWKRIVATCCTLLIAAMLFRCGTDKDDKKDDSNTPPTNVTVPSDWDGLSDWQGSALKATDE